MPPVSDVRFPEVLVEREGVVPTRVTWVPEDGDVLDLTRLRILRIEAVIEPGDVPKITLTMAARLVDVEP